MFLTREQVDTLSYKECQQHLALLTKTYNLDKPLKDCWTEVWPILDQITDTLLYLEDQIQYHQMATIARNANNARYGLPKVSLDDDLDLEEQEQE